MGPKLLRAGSWTLLLLMVPVVFGQQLATGTLSGRVVDPNGAVIVGANVTATHKATAARREMTTNDEGLFVFSSLAPGVYELRVEQQGFEVIEYASIEVLVGQSPSLNITLQVGAVRGDDFGAQPLIEPTSSVVDRLIGRSEIASLPLNGRNFLELALLAPGNSPAPNFDPTKTNTVLISSAGQLGHGGNVTIDGADNNDDVVGG